MRFGEFLEGKVEATPVRINEDAVAPVKKPATFRVRGVKTGEGDYMGIVRLGSGEMILETTYKDRSQNSILYNTLNRLLPGWEVKEIYSEKVPSENPFDGKF